MRLLGLLIALLGLFTPFLANGVINIYTNKAEYLAASGATNATGPLPNLGARTGTVKIGSVTYSRLAGATKLFIGSGGAIDHSIRLPGHEIAVTGTENIAANFDRPVYAAGFDMVEPEFDPYVNFPFVESTFLIGLKNGAVNIGSFYYEPPNDTAAFCGVISDRPFDRLEITEVVGSQDEEFFGEFHTTEAVQTVTFPVSGRSVPELAALDAAMRTFLDDSLYPGVSLAVTFNGRLVFERAYGWTDYYHNGSLVHTQALTVASVSKTLSDMAITKLLGEGRIAGSAKVLELLGITPPPGMSFVAGAEDITVDQVVAHTSGFPEYKADNTTVGNLLGLGRPVSFAELIAWQATQPLLFVPGTGNQYSNFGYEVLGVIIEQVTGMSYGEYVCELFAGPLEANSIQVPPELQITNAAPRTTLLAETYGNNAAAGGIQITSSDLCRIMRAYRLNGTLKPAPVPGGSFFFTFFGSADGVLSVVNQRISGGVGVEFAVTANNRGTVGNQELKDRVIAVLDTVPEWPTHDLFPSLKWKMDNFWNFTTGYMAAKAGFEEDYDGDGVPNLAEYAFGLDPKTGPASVVPPMTVSYSAGQFFWQMVGVPSKTDCVFELLSSTDLSLWTPVARAVGEQSGSALEAGYSLNESGSGSGRTFTVGRSSGAGDAPGYFRWGLRLENSGW